MVSSAARLLRGLSVLAILVAVTWDLSVVWSRISLMTNGVEHLFMCFLAICVSSLEVSVPVLCPFLNLVGCLFITELSSSSYALDTRTSSGI